MADAPKPKPRGGCLSRIAVFFVLSVLIALGAALVLIFQPQRLDDIQGYAPASAVDNFRDLNVTLRESHERNFPVTITEAQINAWISHRLAMKQGGMLSGSASLENVWIRLEEGRAEIITERKVFGLPFTTSLYVMVSQTESPQGQRKEILLQGGPYHADTATLLRGGRFGRLVVPQGFLILVLPAYEKMAAVFKSEIEQGLHEMAVIEIKKGKLILNPSDNGDSSVKLPGSF